MPLSQGLLSFLLLLELVLLNYAAAAAKIKTNNRRHQLQHLSDETQIQNMLSSDEMTAILIQSKHGSNANVSAGYKIEHALKTISKSTTNVFQLFHADAIKQIQKTHIQSIFAKSITGGLPCLLIYQWGLKSIQSSIPLSASTLMQLTKKNKKHKLKKELLEMLNTFVPSYKLKRLQGNETKLKKWLHRGKKRIPRIVLPITSNVPPAWYRRLSLLYNSRIKLGWITKTNTSMAWIRMINATNSTQIQSSRVVKYIQTHIKDVYVSRITTQKQFQKICKRSCIIGVFQFGNLNGGSELESLQKLATRAFQRVEYGERGLLDMKVEKAPIKFGWMMASQQETFVNALNLIRTPCLVSLNNAKKVYSVHQSRIPMNDNKMYNFVKKLLTGQHTFTKWVSKHGFDTLLDVEHPDREPTDVPVWYESYNQPDL